MKFKKFFTFSLLAIGTALPIATLSAKPNSTLIAAQKHQENESIIPESELNITSFKKLYVQQYMNILNYYIDKVPNLIMKAYGEETVETSRFTNEKYLEYKNYSENIKKSIFAKIFNDDFGGFYGIKGEIKKILETDINNELIQILISPQKINEYLSNNKTSRIQSFNIDLQSGKTADFNYAQYQYAKTINLLMLKEFNPENAKTIEKLWNQMDEIVSILVRANKEIKKQKNEYEVAFKSNEVFENMFYNKKSKIKEIQDNKELKDLDKEKVFKYYSPALTKTKTPSYNKLIAEEKIKTFQKYLNFNEFKNLFYIESGNPYNSKIQNFNNYSELIKAIKSDSSFQGLDDIYIEHFEIPGRFINAEKYYEMLKVEYKLLKYFEQKNNDISEILKINGENIVGLKIIMSSKLNNLYDEKIYTNEIFNKYLDATLYFIWALNGGRSISMDDVDYNTFKSEFIKNKDKVNEIKSVFTSVGAHWFPLSDYINYALGETGTPLDFIMNNLTNEKILVTIKDILKTSNNSYEKDKNIYFNTYIEKLTELRNSFNISASLAKEQIEKLHNIENEIINDLNLNNEEGESRNIKMILKSFLSSMVRGYEGFLKKISKTDADSKLELKLEEIDSLKQSAFILKELAIKVIDYMSRTKNINLTAEKEELENLDFETDNVNNLINNYHQALLLLSKLPFTEEDKDTVFSEKFDSNFNKIQNRPEMITLLNALPKNIKPQVIIERPNDTEQSVQNETQNISPIFAALISATVVCGIASLIGLGLLVKNKKS
ncbi:hypothetical protein [Mycoplasma sp. 2634B]|uniref:hypothetical protein n=1 Tax=Mycoplasma sp. 2634B TaxID=3401692 RepID=UPI003AAE7461